jgi:hypothetical protein
VGFCDGQKWCWGRFSPRTSVSPANLHSICFSTIIFTITRGWHNWPGVAAVPIASQSRIKKKNEMSDGSPGTVSKTWVTVDKTATVNSSAQSLPPKFGTPECEVCSTPYCIVQDKETSPCLSVASHKPPGMLWQTELCMTSARNEQDSYTYRSGMRCYI